MTETPAAAAPPHVPQIPAEFLVERQGVTFIAYRGLIHLAHQQGLSATSTQLVQAPSAENQQTAIVTALVTTERGTFAGMGDASPGNVPKMIQPHLLRMAETRALARALRVATNAAYTALEELGGDDAPAGDQPGAVSRASGPAAADRILVGGKPFTRGQVWGAYQQRVAGVRASGVPVPADLLDLPEDAPLSALVGAAQRLRQLTVASGQHAGASDGAPAGADGGLGAQP